MSGGHLSPLPFLNTFKTSEVINVEEFVFIMQEMDRISRVLENLQILIQSVLPPLLIISGLQTGVKQ